MASSAPATACLLPPSLPFTSYARSSLLRFPCCSGLRLPLPKRLGFLSPTPSCFPPTLLPDSVFPGKASRGVVFMAKKSVEDLIVAELKGKNVFGRVDLNVPIDEDQNITDVARIRAAISTIKHLIQNDAKVIISSHLGRDCDFNRKD